MSIVNGSPSPWKTSRLSSPPLSDTVTPADRRKHVARPEKGRWSSQSTWLVVSTHVKPTLMQPLLSTSQFAIAPSGESRPITRMSSAWSDSCGTTVRPLAKSMLAIVAACAAGAAQSASTAVARISERMTGDRTGRRSRNDHGARTAHITAPGDNERHTATTLPSCRNAACAASSN